MTQRGTPSNLRTYRILAVAAAFAASLGQMSVAEQVTSAEPATQAATRSLSIYKDVGQLLTGRVTSKQKIGFVIGSSNYEYADDLANAIGDANLFASFLETQGYRVLEYTDVTRIEFERILATALLEIEPGAEVVFYFAGHGFQIGSRNYLVPVDAKMSTLYDVPHQTIALDSILAVLAARARVHIVILDSCRDNPFIDRSVLNGLSKSTATISNGFSFQASPINSLLSYSTAPGALALDGVGGADSNSPFTRALVDIATTEPDATITSILEKVRQRVFEDTNGYQVPFENSSLIERVTFGGLASGDKTGANQDHVTPDTDAAQSVKRQINASQKPVQAQMTPDGTLVLSADMERTVDIGEAVGNALGLPDGADVRFGKLPEFGRLSLRNDDGSLSIAPRSIPGALLSRLVYETGMVPRSQEQLRGERLVDSFELTFSNGPRRVDVSLLPVPCDRTAGGVLDPQGLALPRFEYEIDPTVALPACEAAVEREPDNARFQYQLGRALRAAKQPVRARVAFERAMELGHIRSIMATGVMIHSKGTSEKGLSEGPAPEEAVALYRRGANLGDPYAFHALGRHLLRYGATPADRELGYDYLVRATEMGHAAAMDELGRFFLQDQTEYYDPIRAINYFRDGVARGSTFSFYNMGIVYRDGLIEADKAPQLALEWFEKASDAGHPRAPVEVGRLYGTPDAIAAEPDYAKATEWFVEGLSRGDGWGGVLAARVLLAIPIEGFDKVDAAIFAAKASVLADETAAGSAREILSGLDRDLIDAASQKIMRDLGVDIAIDGSFGPASQKALGVFLAGQDVPANPLERLSLLATRYWQENPVRADLF